MTVAPVTGARRITGVRRVAVGVLLGVLGLGLALWPPGFALLCTAISIGCLWEFAQLSARKGTAIEFPVALIAVIAYMALTYLHQIHRFEGVLLGATVIVALAAATFRSTSGSVARSGLTLLGVLYIGKLISYFITIRALPSIGTAATIWAIVMIAFTDIFAMVVGTSIGRTPLTPISPKKTVEGAVGGLVFAIAAGIGGAMTPWLHLAPWQGVVIGAIVSIGAQAGDLVESAFKRDALVKDAGSLISGHGGVLDRFDSYIFGGVAMYFALWLVNAIPRGLGGS
jgi:phosphatidate cytidylyltransferase